MGPDEEALRRDLESLAFKVGERRGKWYLKGLRFPYALFFVQAAQRPSGPEGFLLRSDCAGYSAVAPTSQLWHGGDDAALVLDHRPKTAQDVVITFSKWQPCLYHPVDRLARGHWPDKHHELAWTPDKDITFLLEIVYDSINDSQYVGANLPAEALNMPLSFMDEDFDRTALPRTG